METVFFEEGNVRVTNTRFVVGNQTYAMQGVTSVRSHITDPDRKFPALICLIGVGVIFFGGWGAKLMGAGMVALGIWIWSKQRPINTVLLCSASGEVSALDDAQDKSVQIAAVIAALNDAIIHRG
jgi:hypothetical protein